jgi:hypothetical protein
MKWSLILLMLLLMIPIVKGIDLCEIPIHGRANCTIVTPTLNCSNYTYDLINTSNAAIIINNGALYLLNNSIYQFNFSKPKGGYLAELCDGSTREIIVGEDENMYLAIIIGLALAVLVFFFLGMHFDDVYIKTLKGTNIPIIKYTFLLCGGWLMLVIVGVVESATSINHPELLASIDTFYMGYFYIIIIISAVWVLGIFWVAIMKLKMTGEEVLK